LKGMIKRSGELSISTSGVIIKLINVNLGASQRSDRSKLATLQRHSNYQ
jgi:hypothetical protein